MNQFVRRCLLNVVGSLLLVDFMLKVMMDVGFLLPYFHNDIPAVSKNRMVTFLIMTQSFFLLKGFYFVVGFAHQLSQRCRCNHSRHKDEIDAQNTVKMHRIRKKSKRSHHHQDAATPMH